MSAKLEGSIAIAVAIIVLFSSMWDPRVSAAVSLLALVSLGVYKLTRKQSDKS